MFCQELITQCLLTSSSLVPIMAKPQTNSVLISYFKSWYILPSLGNMLDNTELIGTLDETKSKATEVSEKLALAATTSVDIDKTRDG